MNKRKRTLTFMVIPEANQKIREFKVPKLFLYAIPFLIVGLIVITFMEYHLHKQSIRYNVELKQQLAFQEEQMRSTLAQVESELKTTISLKDRTIQALYEDIETVNLQAEEVQVKVDQLKQLEDELRGITGLEKDEASQADTPKDQPVTISSISAMSANTQYGPFSDFDVSLLNSGGQFYPLEDEELIKRADLLSDSLVVLHSQLEQLHGDLTNSKDIILAQNHLRDITPSIWPTSARLISSTFGTRRDPFHGRWSNHTGLDIAGKSGSSIFATASGKVTVAGYNNSEGYHIEINHSNGIRTVYMHLSKLLVKKGQSVKKGEKIGLMGSTGRSTGSHVHYEVIVNGKAVNPVSYLQERKDLR